jgi:hypothetical protein
METFLVWFFKFLTLVFTIGWIGCLLTIPLAAYKFVSVLFEKDSDEPEQHQDYGSAAATRI